MVQQLSERAKTAAYLANSGPGRTFVKLDTAQVIFAEGDRADSVYYLHTGGAKLTVASKGGHQTIVALCSTGDFVGEESIAQDAATLRTLTATAVAPCIAVKIEGREMVRMIHENQGFRDAFRKFLLDRIIRSQADLANRIFDAEECRRIGPACPGSTERMVS